MPRVSACAEVLTPGTRGRTQTAETPQFSPASYCSREPALACIGVCNDGVISYYIVALYRMVMFTVKFTVELLTSKVSEF